MRRILPLLFLLASAGCSSMGNDVYALADIQVKEVRQEGGQTIVSYQPMMETLFFSPGVRIEPQGDDLVLSAVRCRAEKKSCEVDAKATLDGPLAIVTVPSPKGRIYWSDGDGRKEVEVAP